MASSADMARAVLVAVLLVHCCNVVVAARLLEADGAWLQGGSGAGALILHMLKGGSAPGTPNCCTTDPNNCKGQKCHG